jgi:hypothetical protein
MSDLAGCGDIGGVRTPVVMSVPPVGMGHEECVG